MKKWIPLGRFKFRDDSDSFNTSHPVLRFVIQEDGSDSTTVFEMFQRHDCVGGDYCFKQPDDLGISFEHLALIVKHRFALIDVFKRMFELGQEYEGTLGKPPASS